MKKVWSLFKGSTTAVIYADDVDHAGFVPGMITDPDMHEGTPFYGLIKPEEWAPFEVIPVPPAVPNNAWLVVYGDDFGAPQYSFHIDESSAKAEVAARSNAFGHVPVHIPRFGMTPK